MWTFYTLPDKGWEGNFSRTTDEGEDLQARHRREKAAMAQYGDAWQRGGGVGVDDAGVRSGVAQHFFAVGNPSPDLDGTVRPGDNLYTESIVAVDATTGEYKWHYQQVPHDVWDFDATSPPVDRSSSRMARRRLQRQARLRSCTCSTPRPAS